MGKKLIASYRKNQAPLFRRAASLALFVLLSAAAALPPAFDAARAAPEKAEASSAAAHRQAGADTDEIRDIRPPMGYEFEGSNRRGLAALAAAVALIGYLWSRRRERPVEAVREDAPPPVPPETAAHEALRELDASGLLESGRLKEYYMRLSLIVRAYTGGALGFNCVDMHTGESLAKLSALGAARGNIMAFEAISRECDLVKFAKFSPSAEDARLARAAAENFINITAGAGFR